jgi:hypothetical protein
MEQALCKRRRALGNVTSQLPASASTFELVDGVGQVSHLECPEILATTILGRLAG